MNNQFAAQQGTFLRVWDADGDTKDIPVVGWMNITGQLAMPLTPVPNPGTDKNSMVVVPPAGDPADGEWYFCHRATGVVCYSHEDAGEYMAEYLGENPIPEPTEKGDASVKSSDPQPGPDTRPLHFGSQTYKTKSFWHWPDANAVFEIEGEQVYPSDPRAIKVKREEYAQFKRDGAVVIDPHVGVITEEPANEAPAEDEDEDFSDVV
jgi:hypothetical protein